ncbi:sugar transferase [uncultured Fibrella sp.]|uniref:sugar transferase n=1 Tax=uncultured Fibrella sp. TaxID=1284596 RepID=UPI0035CC8281
MDSFVGNSTYYAVADKTALGAINPTWYVRYGKRTFDLVFSLLCVIFILSWLIPVVGILIKLCCPGPIFFLQKRNGQHGRPFWCLKFRTMRHKPDDAFAQCEKDDPRVTRIGRFLRKTNLDEMPQFVNVLIGNMSVVGPRPHAVQHDDKFWFALENYPARYQVRPGITGLAQVRGARGETSTIIKMKHRVKYDLVYIKHQSFGLDAKLCYNTVRAMLRGNVENAW